VYKKEKTDKTAGSRSLEKRILSPRIPPVTRLAVGSLTVGPLQADLSVECAGEILAYAFDSGINFLDTAQYYRNYAHIREGLKRCRCPENVVISSKSYAYDAKGAMHAVEEARRELDRDKIDIFMLHEQESIHTLRGHREALECLFTLREKGIIGAVGISTHHIAAVEGAMILQEEGMPLDVVHPLFNKAGIGIADGTAAQMADALERLHRTGCGIFGMKALGGGHLYKNAGEAFSFVLSHDFMDAVAVGMQSAAEIDANIAYFTAGAFPDATTEQLNRQKRQLRIEEYCEACGNCAKRCPQNAITIVELAEEDMDDNPYDFSGDFAAAEKNHKRAQVAAEKCVLCGYCTAVCPVFALKVY